MSIPKNQNLLKQQYTPSSKCLLLFTFTFIYRMLYCVLWDMFRLQRAAIVSQSLHNMESHSTLPDWEPFRRLLKTSSLTFRPKTPSFQKFQFLKFTYFPLFLNWHPPYFRGACCASTLSTGKCWCRQFPPSHSCRFLKSSPSWYVFRFSFP